MDLQMRGIVIGFALLLNIANADYTGRLPNAITLQGGEPQTHSAIMDCSSYWECVFGDFAYNFTYSTKGNTDSTLTLNGTLPPNPTSQKQRTPFFIGNMTINPHSNLIMQGFESFNLGASLNINGGSLAFQNGNFATLFGTNISVSNGGKLGVVGIGFTNRGNMSANNATISIIPTSARNYGNIYNNNGDITIGTNLYNIGQKTAYAGASPSSVANIVNNGGKLTIQGNLYNGGQENQNRLCQVEGCGGGNLITFGGEIIIQGQLTSQAKDGQPSSITIKGGNLTATGGVQNLAGSTLTIGADNSGKMGQLIVGGGQKINNSGEIIVDLMGMNAGIIKPFIDTNGNSSSLITGNTQISIRNGNSDFANASGFDNASGTINFIINQNSINHFKTTLNNNESATLTRFGDDIYTISGASSANLKSSANDINRAIFSAFYATNLAVMESLAFDSDLIFSKQRSTKRVVNPRQARQRQVRKISTKSANPNNINAGFIVQGISGDANGILGGIRAGYGVDFVRGRFALNFAYAYGNLKNALDTFIATQNLATKSHNLTLGANLNARFAGNFGVDLGLSGFMIFANHTREIKSNRQISSLKSNQNIYQIAVDLAFVYDFKITNFMIAPYLGLNQGFLAMPKFAEAGGDFSLNAEAYNAYFLNVILGAKMGFDFRNYGAILGKIDYKFLAYNSQKTHILHYANSTDSFVFKIPNTHKIAFDLGYQKDFGAWYLRVNGNFGAIFNATKSSDTNTNFYTYGLEAKFGWKF